MRATGTAAEILKACDKVKQEFAKTYAELAPKTEKRRQGYIKHKLHWDIFRRNAEYWSERWNRSSQKALVEQCNGTSWLQHKEEIVTDVEKQVKALNSLDNFTLSDAEVHAFSYIHG